VHLFTEAPIFICNDNIHTVVF